MSWATPSQDKQRNNQTNTDRTTPQRNVRQTGQRDKTERSKLHNNNSNTPRPEGDTSEIEYQGRTRERTNRRDA